MSSIELSSALPPMMITLYPDLGWIQALFSFQTGIGSGTAFVRLGYLPTGEWKAWVLFTMLEELKCHPPADIDTSYPDQLDHAKIREQEKSFLDTDPAVIIIGGGQAGLGVAAILKVLGITSLIVEQHERVGDQWRKDRYASLRLHDPVWRDHLPLFPLPEPPLWPVFMPGAKVGDFLEAYAMHLDLNVWTSSKVSGTKWDPSTKTWSVTIVTKGSERRMKTRHVVWAIGLNGNIPILPNIKNSDAFQGEILHSCQYRVPEPYRGKKVIIGGSGVSGHDICMDLASEGTDVIMIQRNSTFVMSAKNATPTLYKLLYWKGGPPTEIADVISNSLPHKLVLSMSVRLAARMTDMDRELLDGLNQAGFKTDMGPQNAGTFRSATKRAGGWYINVGASDLIIDGRIKVKSGSPPTYFTAQGLVFADGTELPADVVIYATGYESNLKDDIGRTFGRDFTSKLREIWDWDEEYELNSVWRDSGHEAFYVATTNLPGCRFWSRFLALQIEAMERACSGRGIPNLGVVIGALYSPVNAGCDCPK